MNALLAAAADELERLATSGPRSPFDVCRCGGDRQHHLGQEIGCVDYCCMFDTENCRSFRLNHEVSIDPDKRRLIAALRREAKRYPDSSRRPELVKVQSVHEDARLDGDARG